MAGFLKKTPKNADFAKGGNTPMFGEQAAEAMPSGTTRDPTSQDAAPGDKFAKGGSNKMFGYAGAETAKAGITSAR
jgi:hypothetical protein